MKRIGFWKTGMWIGEPNPVIDEQEDWPGKANWMAALTMLQIRIINSQREDVPLGMTHAIEESYHCPHCGVEWSDRNFVLEDFEWPSYYGHFIADHGVVPHPEFKAFITDWAHRNISVGGQPFVVEA